MRLRSTPPYTDSFGFSQAEQFLNEAYKNLRRSNMWTFIELNSAPVGNFS
jgi:hypothetical protein